MRRYLEPLTDSNLAGDTSYHSASRGPRRDPTWQVLVHVVNHGTDHRAQTLAMLHGAGHRHCHFHAQDLTASGPIPGAPFDVVYARLLLFHLPQRVAVLARLWDAVAPGGHLIVQDYDIRTAGVLPALDSVDELLRVINGAFDVAGCDVSAGARLAQLFAQAGVGNPGGTDVAGRIEPLEDVTDGCVRGRSTPSKTERFVQPATMNVDEGDDATGRIAARHDGKNRKQQHVGQAVEFSLSPTRVGNFSQQIQQRSKSSHGNPRLRLPP
jgi:hypothetical protein